MSDNKASRPDVPYDIRERTFQYAVKIVGLVRRLPRDAAADVLGRQLLRAATSVGANVEEADGATTARDRSYKRAIARKEAREARYWLRLIRSCVLDNQDARALQIESEELIRILSALIAKNVPPP